jgi:hypothetical protein
MPISRPLAACVAACASLLLLSCNGSVSAGSGAAPNLRVVNLASGAPYNFDVSQDKTSVVTNLAYGQASSFKSTGTGGTTITFDPTGTTTAAITANLTLSSGTNYSVLALQGSSALTSLAVADAAPSLGTGQAQISFVNAAPAQGALDFYVTSPTAALPLAAAQSNIAYAGAGATVTPTPYVVTGGDYRIRAVKNGDTTRSIVFDSGPLVFTAGTSPLLVAVAVSGSAAPIALVSLGSDSTVTTIGDQRVMVRVGNFAPANGAVDVYFDQNGVSNGATAPFATNVAQNVASPFQSLMPGAYHASFASSGQTTELVGNDLTLAAATSVSVFAAGVLNQANPYGLKLLVVHDDLRAPATGMAKLRVVQLSPDLGGLVDLVPLTISGGTTTVGQTIINSLGYAGASPYATLAPGTYTLAVVPTGSQAPLLPSNAGVSVVLTANTVTTLVVAGCQHPSSGVVCATSTTPLQFVQRTD